MLSWLEDLFYLVAFVVAVGLVTLSIYDGPLPEPSTDREVAMAVKADVDDPPTTMAAAL